MEILFDSIFIMKNNRKIQISSSDNRHIGKPAIKVLNNYDLIERTINITGSGKILGGGDGGTYQLGISTYRYRADYYISVYVVNGDSLELDHGPEIVSRESITEQSPEKYNISGINASYFNGTNIIYQLVDTPSSYYFSKNIPEDGVYEIIPYTTEQSVLKQEHKSVTYNEYPIIPEHQNIASDTGFHYPNFNETPTAINLPSNNLVTLRYI